MLQRIQTIWLFISSLVLFGLFLFPYIQFVKTDGAAQAIKVTGVYENIGGQPVKTQEFILLTIVTVIVALLPLVVIFYFRNRKRQIALCYVTILVILGYSFWLVQSARQVIGNVELDLPNYGIGVILPSLSIFFIILALKGIRKDEKLIKSADRLR